MSGLVAIALILVLFFGSPPWDVSTMIILLLLAILWMDHRERMAKIQSKNKDEAPPEA